MKSKPQSLLRFTAPLLRGWGPLGALAFICVVTAVIIGLYSSNSLTENQSIGVPKTIVATSPIFKTHDRDSPASRQPPGFSDWLSKIEQLPEGDEKEAAVKACVDSANADSLGLALKKLQDTRDAGVLRVAQQVLATKADATTVQTLIDLYDADPPNELRRRLVDTMGALTSEAALPSLIGVITDPETSPLDEMIRAAAHSLAATGKLPGIDALLGRIHAEPTPEGRAVLTTALSIAASPDLASALRETALGQNKLAYSDDARTAAIQTLGNMHDDESRHALQSLATDSNQQVAETAIWMLSRNGLPLKPNIGLRGQ